MIEVDPLRALDALIALLRQKTVEQASEDEFNLITRAIELINERRPVFEDGATYYMGVDKPSKPPYKVTLQTCTCPRGRELICKHRLLIQALNGAIADTRGFKYARYKRKPDNIEAQDQMF